MDQSDEVLLPDGRKTSELKVAELKKELEKLNKSRSGVKNELLSRLNQALTKNRSEDEPIEETNTLSEEESRTVTVTNNAIGIENKTADIDTKLEDTVDLDDDLDSHQISHNETQEDLVLDAPNDESLNPVEDHEADETFEMEVKHNDLANESINEDLKLNKSISDRMDVSEKLTENYKVSMDSTGNIEKSPKNDRMIICKDNDDDGEKIELITTQDEMYEVFIDSQLEEEERKVELSKIAIDNDSSNEKELKNKVEIKENLKDQSRREDELKSDVKLEDGELLPITARLGKRLPTTPTSADKKSSETNKPSFASTMAHPIKNEEPVRMKSPQKARFPKSSVLRIDNLVRPFTPGQLKEMLTLLTGEGTVKDIWLNRIKSVAYIRYSDDSVASESREKLDGCKWPSINNKLLSVDFSTLNEMEDIQTNDSISINDRPLPNTTRTVVDRKETDTAKQSSRRDDKSRDVHYKRHGDDHNNKSDGRPDARHNITESRRRKRSRSPNTKRRSYEDAHTSSKHKRISDVDKEPLEKKSAPVTQIKTLEELFRKTVTQPAIYWLPANKEKQEARKAREQPKALLAAVTKS